ncbi:MAG: HEAT repeat domain-containing protein [Vicinamibacterales bacterium]
MTPTFDPMSADQSGVLADFARACKAAARSVSLYPSTHPAIESSLGRIVATSARLTAAGDVTLVVHPGVIAIEGRAPARTDQAIGELADLLHERLVGELTIRKGADELDWHALLLLLARAPEDLRGEGGIGQAWMRAGRTHFEIREIDYAEMLRERTGGDALASDRVIEYCLQGGTADGFDERSLATLADAVGDPARLGDLIHQLQRDRPDGTTMGARASALLTLFHGLVHAAGQRQGNPDGVHQAVADAFARLTPEMLMALMRQARNGSPEDRALVSRVTARVDDDAIASFVASSVIAGKGATVRLAEAFEALVPDVDRKGRLLDLAHQEVQASPLGSDPGFEDLWQGTAGLLMTYSDSGFVSEEYDRELSSARVQAVDVERVADDPPARVEAWLSTISPAALHVLDLALLLDLLRIEGDPSAWQPIAAIVSTSIERRMIGGDVEGARRLLDALAGECRPGSRDELREAARAAMDTLASGRFGQHIVANLRQADEPDVEALADLCRSLGPGIITPLAEALAIEEQARAIRRLRELLLSFGAAGRHTIEQLKQSPNPAVRRTAIDLIRAFGGHDALADLASMLDDADPHVQRESIRAIVQIGSSEAYAVLERALLAGSASRETIVQQLTALGDDNAVPLLCHVLDTIAPRGRLVALQLQIVDALSGFSAHPDSTRTLRQLLYHGVWWAPVRTARLRRAAAAALHRIGTPDTTAVIDEAAARGPRGVRSAVRAEIRRTGERRNP